MLNKRGSVILFLSMIFTSLIILIFTLAHLSIDRGIYSATDSLARVWGTDVLSFYDTYLYQDYDIYAFEGKRADSISTYMDKSYKDKKYIKNASVSENLMDYGLIDPNNFQLAIKDCIKVREKMENNKEERKLVNMRIFESLPSRIDKTTSLSKKDKASSLMYALNHFNSYTNMVNPYSFFKNEVEYLICGKNSDSLNRKALRRKFVATRIGPNSAYIYTKPKMMEETLALANVLTPGPEAALTQIALIETWATFESENDWKIILDGGKVPLAKTDSSWALKDSSILKKKEAGYVKMNNATGLGYTDYLKVMLLAENEKKLLLRMMDLIQINMRLNHYDDFLISDYYTGMQYTINVNGEDHDYVMEYKKR
ncbi:MAG: DUF5702 domain-containing protein [Clostridia bacterium]|nr:DUF5702 domain-containing protein [Clostridia bacterium]